MEMQSQTTLDIHAFARRWESFREVAMKRQTAINEKLMRLQRKEMTAIREWMTNTEDKISRFVYVHRGGS